MSEANTLTPKKLLASPTTSRWLREALLSSLQRDPVDALNDALALASALEDRLREVLELGKSA